MHSLKKLAKKYLKLQDLKKCQEIFGQIALLVESFIEIPVLLRNIIASVNKYINTKKEQIVFVNENYMGVEEAWKLLLAEVKLSHYNISELYLGSIGETADKIIGKKKIKKKIK